MEENSREQKPHLLRQREHGGQRRQTGERATCLCRVAVVVLARVLELSSCVRGPQRAQLSIATSFRQASKPLAKLCVAESDRGKGEKTQKTVGGNEKRGQMKKRVSEHVSAIHREKQQLSEASVLSLSPTWPSYTIPVSSPRANTTLKSSPAETGTT